MIDVAGVAIEVVGDHPVAGLLRAELDAGHRQEGSAHGTVIVSDGPPRPTGPGSRSMGEVVLGDDRLQWSFGRSALTTQVDRQRPDGAGWRVDLSIGDRPMPYGIPRPLFRWLEPTFMDPIHAQAYACLHLVLESAVLMFERDVAPLHAAVLERDGTAVVLTSAGGVGKTSTSMAMLADGGWNFLSDDMTVIGPDRPISPYLRRPMVYEYNVRADPRLGALVPRPDDRAGRVQWAATAPLHGRGRRRRVPIDELFGRPVVGRPSKMGLVAFLVRGSGPTVSVRPLTADEMARRCTAVLRTEFTDLVERLLLIEGLGGPDLVDSTFSRVYEIYSAAFAGAGQLVEMALPEGGSPRRTAAELDRLVDR